MNIDSSLIAELRDKKYREAYVASQISIGIPFQIRALRKHRKWNQDQLAEHAKMAQPRISEIEKPGERRLNIETLMRIAAALDIGLQVRFVPFSELIDSSEDLDPDAISIKTFTEELSDAIILKKNGVPAKITHLPGSFDQVLKGLTDADAQQKAVVAEITSAITGPPNSVGFIAKHLADMAAPLSTLAARIPSSPFQDSLKGISSIKVPDFSFLLDSNVKALNGLAQVFATMHDFDFSGTTQGIGSALGAERTVVPKPPSTGADSGPERLRPFLVQPSNAAKQVGRFLAAVAEAPSLRKAS